MLSSALAANGILSLLVSLGLRDLCIAPGSRSAPFALLRSRLPELAFHTHFDERDLGFLALGIARGSGIPAAAVTTSGTAVGNLLPAVMEARMSHIPLILITADRPWELLETGANQTCRQDGIFGSYAVFVHVPVLTSEIELAAAKRRISSALAEALASGIPLHLNVEMREPLYGDPAESPLPARLPANDNQAGEHSFTDLRPETLPGNSLLTTLKTFLAPESPALIAAGSLPPEDAALLAEPLRKTGHPVIADIQSNLRGRIPVLPPFDLLTARLPGAYERLRTCRRLIVLEGHFISKKLLSFIRDFPGEVIFITKYTDGINASGHPGPVIRITPEVLRKTILSLTDGNPAGTSVSSGDPFFTENPCLMPGPVMEKLSSGNAAGDRLTEASVIAALSKLETPLLIGNSLPARLADTLLCPEYPRGIFTSRGVSGIDGLIAAAAGLSHCFPDTGITAVIGDTSALYDLSGIALLRKYRVRLIILNNNGGNIFMKFPVPDEAILKELFVNPQNVTFAGAAGMFGIPWRQVTREAELRDLIRGPAAGEVLEIPLPPGEGINMLRELTAEAPGLPSDPSPSENKAANEADQS
ncbi:2-succinyl-5-enolpyruvyl-6-hydroxy-3-cyclohexene-1-carboxylic-acid synthase [Succinimonas sp.]|uniref:2-succinyl-5-enolpyruvyl-6-hydroxy-3- cyclohexene-1-carboxylic-acid synthase n=1 Tax=Succinimonas sp. TaxID=1936151 RepID=UPI00386F6262